MFLIRHIRKEVPIKPALLALIEILLKARALMFNEFVLRVAFLISVLKVGVILMMIRVRSAFIITLFN